MNLCKSYVNSGYKSVIKLTHGGEQLIDLNFDIL